MLHDFMYHTLYHKRRFQGILCYTSDIRNTRQKKKSERQSIDYHSFIASAVPSVFAGPFRALRRPAEHMAPERKV
ncbi:hypothetical protein, partial [Alistipes senegalensis]|uniref:hypothetical protein n=1 Tax=Alistipes senegalensis TaxID=1288121 RepID=UPI001E56F3AB